MFRWCKIAILFMAVSLIQPPLCVSARARSRESAFNFLFHFSFSFIANQWVQLRKPVSAIRCYCTFVSHNAQPRRWIGKTYDVSHMRSGQHTQLLHKRPDDWWALMFAISHKSRPAYRLGGDSFCAERSSFSLELYITFKIHVCVCVWTRQPCAVAVIAVAEVFNIYDRFVHTSKIYEWLSHPVRFWIVRACNFKKVTCWPCMCATCALSFLGSANTSFVRIAFILHNNIATVRPAHTHTHTFRCRSRFFFSTATRYIFHSIAANTSGRCCLCVMPSFTVATTATTAVTAMAAPTKSNITWTLRRFFFLSFTFAYRIWMS